MKKWVVQGSSGLEIVGTAGNEPHNALCEADDLWMADELSFDTANKVVFVDPEKIKAKDLAKQRAEFKMNVTKLYKESVNWGRYLGYGLLFICLALLLAKYLKAV